MSDASEKALVLNNEFVQPLLKKTCSALFSLKIVLYKIYLDLGLMFWLLISS